MSEAVDIKDLRKKMGLFAEFFGGLIAEWVAVLDELEALRAEVARLQPPTQGDAQGIEKLSKHVSRVEEHVLGQLEAAAEHDRDARTEASLRAVLEYCRKGPIAHAELQAKFAEVQAIAVNLKRRSQERALASSEKDGGE